MFSREMALSDLRRAELLAAQSGDTITALQMDEDTFRAFYDRTARPLWAYLARITGDRQVADDLLQESYYRFLRAGAEYENDAHRRNSLFRVATNLARDAHRRARLRPWLGRQDTEDVSVLVAPGGADHLDQRSDLERAMRRLRPRDRAMLWLAYAEGSTHREIATTLGLNAGSVKLMLFRARRKLSALLGRDAPGDALAPRRDDGGTR
jgi:RNA polymerase sigma-70 factor, ECF subfamily